MIRYGLLREIPLPFTTVVQRLPEELRKKGFEIISDIGLDELFTRELDIRFKRYRIMGICNLPLVYKMLSHEENLGLLLPHNVIIYEKGDSSIAGMIRPGMFLSIIDNWHMEEGAAIIERKFNEVLQTLGRQSYKPENKVQSPSRRRFADAVA
jgi:uncharacterized protein (DUF302 family)